MFKCLHEAIIVLTAGWQRVEGEAMRKWLSVVCVVMLLASFASAAPASPDTKTPGKISPGIRYQLMGALDGSSKIHTIFFVLYDTAGKMVVTEKFTGRMPKAFANPVFALLRDDDARAAVMARATSMIVTVDGQLVDKISMNEFLRRAGDLVALDSSLSPFTSARTKVDAAPSRQAPKAPGTASSTLHPRREDTWQGCANDEYCAAQWTYCNDNCSPWDPYNPCEACNSNYTECTGGVELDAWSEDTLISSTAEPLPVCGDLTQIYAQFKTYTQYTNYTHHQEFQYWRCSDGEGDHYTVVTTVDNYSYSYCYHLIDAGACNSNFRYYISCTF
ncbi:MAG TPA: hypothetical protein VGQ21_03875 [Thermoanaerobaculia bacterium]|nr:hypothetical protein [Thermoanaerobaculia bacterium]